MNETELTRVVVSTLESLGIPYFIPGSIASIALGEPRVPWRRIISPGRDGSD